MRVGVRACCAVGGVVVVVVVRVRVFVCVFDSVCACLHSQSGFALQCESGRCAGLLM